MGDRPGPAADPLEVLPLPHPKVAVRVIHGEAMILTAHDSVLHTLNPVATRIWELLPEHRQFSTMVGALVAEFLVEPEVAEADLRELVTELLEKQILQ